MQRESLLATIMNFVVSGYVYFVALMLVLYMVSSLVTGIFSLVTGLLDLGNSTKGILMSPARTALELGLLHTIAFTIVLVKAYKILISYAQTRSINIKFLIEIAIIGPTIELLFNSSVRSAENFWIAVLLAAFAFCNLLAYLFFYKTIKKASDDYEKDCA